MLLNFDNYVYATYLVQREFIREENKVAQNITKVTLGYSYIIEYRKYINILKCFLENSFDLSS